jgi:hypothetical protein
MVDCCDSKTVREADCNILRKAHEAHPLAGVTEHGYGLLPKLVFGYVFGKIYAGPIRAERSCDLIHRQSAFPQAYHRAGGRRERDCMEPGLLAPEIGRMIARMFAALARENGLDETPVAAAAPAARLAG